ncbi:(2Fe-2S)-binding protein [Sporosarcina sp. ACRSM]|uniref:(2Fe-2S)-binding protein n=1 Tax=Sporosarcina sp. ACRSM TaxID=2918216 RepID=UPI001EF734DF|nr:(2Fe-2S)-binding protein [Sporosarcina sp. ACRSM]MCG7334465.1 (2Fe-2S)-binding protein [Sporosarcina sp. ACRSM]
MILSHNTSKAIIPLLVNGKNHDVVIRSADTLLHTLRDQLGLTGAKQACENGDCGACTVIVNGEPTHACLSLTIESATESITTIEGLADSPVQQAFVDNWAIQCGYCTPGFVVNCHALMERHPDADDKTIEEWMQSNLCRCTGYHEIKEAIQSVLRTKKDLPSTNEDQ